MQRNNIRILLVDDSHFILDSLKHILKGAPQLEVIGTATTGQEALDFIAQHETDVILLDINMPVMDGVEATAQIMERQPTPIIILTAAEKSDPRVIRALELGAIEMMQKPGGEEKSPYLRSTQDELVKHIYAAAGVNINAFHYDPIADARANWRNLLDTDVILIGLSTGGPATMTRLLSSLPTDFPVPIVIVQHIRDGYIDSLATTLQAASTLKITIAKSLMKMRAGHVYLAPSGHHLEISISQTLRVVIGKPVNGFMPAVDVLFGFLPDAEGLVFGLNFNLAGLFARFEQ